MNKKPFSPLMHGLIDYVFSAALLTVPQLAGLKQAKKFYTADAFGTALYSAVTNYPLSIKHIIPYKTHRTIDYINIALLASTVLYKPVRKEKRALVFTISMAMAALVTVLLTDWEAEVE